MANIFTLFFNWILGKWKSIPEETKDAVISAITAAFEEFFRHKYREKNSNENAENNKSGEQNA